MFKLVKDNSKGDYSFGGKALISRAVSLVLSQKEIDNILFQIKEHTKSQTRDYVLVFKNKEGQKVLAIDNLSRSDIEELKASDYSQPEITTHDYFTLVFYALEV